jgi:hypothetical protein
LRSRLNIVVGERPLATFVYRCSATRLHVQGWAADDTSEHDGATYESVTCIACTRVHLVNPKTGKVMGEDDDE